MSCGTIGQLMDFPNKTELEEFIGKAHLIKVKDKAGRYGSRYIVFQIDDQYFRYPSTSPDLINRIKNGNSIAVLAGEQGGRYSHRKVYEIYQGTQKLVSYEHSKDKSQRNIWLTAVILVFGLAGIPYFGHWKKVYKPES